MIGRSQRQGHELAERLQPPGNSAVLSRLRDYMNHADMSAQELADRLGYGRSTMNLFLQGRYGNQPGKSAEFIRTAVWEFLERTPISVSHRHAGRLFHTENYRRVQRYFLAAVEQQEICLLYGPPGTQKTFVLEHLVAERNREKKNDALYVYASENMRPLALLKRIGRQAGALIKSISVDRMIQNLLHTFGLQSAPPAVIVDEAQHLGIPALEILRELHDRSGCGLVLAGSHNLYENFLRGRAHLEQWLSRIDHKDPLPGLLEDEVREIASRELGNGQPAKLGERQVKALVEACRVDDVFAREPDGKPQPVRYLSVRRLVKTLAQFKAAKKEAA